MLSKEVLSTIFKVFGMTRPGIEPRSPGPLANTLPTWPICYNICKFLGFFCFDCVYELRMAENKCLYLGI